MKKGQVQEATPTFVPVRKAAPSVPVVAHSDAQRSVLFMAASHLLDYPGEGWEKVLDAVAGELPALPAESAAELEAFVNWANGHTRLDVEQLYVATFDQRRRCSLELTYYATGDTRQRGIALTIFRDLYRAVGFEPDDESTVTTCLPDYLPMVLELAAVSEGEAHELVEGTIASHREGIEVLHAALRDIDSPWAHVVSALRMGLPSVDDDVFARMQTLIRQGPPSELVGINDHSEMEWLEKRPVEITTRNGAL